MPTSPDLAELTEKLGFELPEEPAEALLQLLPVLDRLDRIELPPLWNDRTSGDMDQDQTTSYATDFTESEKPPAPAPMGKALDLILNGTYRAAEHEYIRVLKSSGFRPPDRLLPQLLARALQSTGGERTQLLDIIGPRGRWLASLHPDWSSLFLPEDPTSVWKRLHLPADMAAFMTIWRQADPDAARKALATRWPDLDGSRQARLMETLSTGLSDEDVPFLLAALGPRRRLVRREATRLLLQIGEPHTTDHFTSLVAESFQLDGHRIVIDLPKPIKDRLEPYGLYEARSSTITVLLEHLPPRLWWELPDLEPFQFINRLLLGPNQAKELLPPLAKACVFYNDQAGLVAISKMVLRFDLQYTAWPKSLMSSLAQVGENQFYELSDWALDQLERALHSTSFMSFLSRQVPYAWSDRLSRASLRMLLEDIELSKLRFQNPSSKFWLPLAYRASVGLFPEFQRELYDATIQYGETSKLATKILQIMSFRRRAFASK
ncbi:MAG: DUF5691 domain-containing protein [Bacteroidota bacterium]